MAYGGHGGHARSILVAAIDFGTTYSGYAFSFRHDFEKDCTKVCSNSWIAGSRNLVSLKTPTTILLNPDKTFHSFGYAAEDKYADLADDEEHEEYYYFRRFKMKLFNAPIKRTTTIPDNRGRHLPALDIFQMSIGHLREHLLDTLEKRSILIEPDEIHWVLTVPAIWNDPAKQFMREAAEKAGIKGEQLTIALEPEAASLFCKNLAVEKINGCDGTFAPFSQGSRYLVLDAGGGTVDITVHEVQRDKTLKELFKANGGAWGGTFVDEAYQNMLMEIVGEDILKTLEMEHTSDYLDMFREFETKKRNIKCDTTGKITIKLPVMVKELFENNSDCSINDKIKTTKYSGQVEWVGDKVRLQASVFREIFQNATESIVIHLRDLFAEPSVKDTNIILMVGGFSESPLLQAEVRKAFPNKKVIIPQEAGLAVLKGAVIFGHCPTSISSRVAKYTYGIDTNTKFKPNVHQLTRKTIINGVEYCKDTFDRHVQKGQELEIKAVQSEKVYTPVRPDQTRLRFGVYTSENMSPSYTDETGCNSLGDMTVDIPDTSGGCNREVVVKMIFGGTELKLEAKEKRTGNITSAKFNFLD